MNAAAAAAVDFKNGFGTQFNGLMQPFTDTDSLYSTAYTSYNNWATKVRYYLLLPVALYHQIPISVNVLGRFLKCINLPLILTYLRLFSLCRIYNIHINSLVIINDTHTTHNH